MRFAHYCMAACITALCSGLAPSAWSSVATDAKELLPGQWQLSTDGDAFTLAANEVPIEDLVEAIREMTMSDIQIKKMEGRKVTARFFNVTLDQLLTRLGLEFVLVYGRSGEDQPYELESGWMSFAQRAPAAPTAATPDAANTNAPVVPIASLDEAMRRKLTGTEDGKIKPEEIGVLQRAAYPVAISLDGDVSDWSSDLPWQRVGHEMGENATNDADASFDVAVVADQENLYLAAKVTDDLKSVEAGKGTPKVGSDDSIEIVVDYSESGAAPGHLPDVNFQINRHQVMMRTQDGGVVLAPKQYVSQSSGVRAVVVDGATGWNVELVVPFTALQYDPNSNEPVAFNVVLRDTDFGKSDQRSLTWSKAQRGAGSTSPTSGLGALQVINVK